MSTRSMCFFDVKEHFGDIWSIQWSRFLAGQISYRSVLANIVTTAFGSPLLVKSNCSVTLIFVADQLKGETAGGLNDNKFFQRFTAAQTQIWALREIDQ